MNGAVRGLAGVAGLAIVAATVLSAVRTIVLPHGRSANLTRLVFVVARRAFGVFHVLPRADHRRHELQSLYAPVGLVLLPLVWIASSLVGFTLVFWSIGVDDLLEAFKHAGSAMLTIGFADENRPIELIVTFVAAALTISLFALLLVTYLPTMYQAYSDRETAIAALETFAGEPADPVELILRHHRIGALDRLTRLWAGWQEHFFSLRETHTALPAVVLFTSSSPGRNWVESAEAVLDAAALWNSVCLNVQDPEASLCIRSGYLALNDIARYFRYEVPSDPAPSDPISVPRERFDLMVSRLADDGIELVADLDEGWIDWAGWRVNYDQAVLDLRRLTGGGR